jgi:hypothetical protein
MFKIIFWPDNFDQQKQGLSIFGLAMSVKSNLPCEIWPMRTAF